MKEIPIPEETLERIAEIFGQHGAAAAALREGAALRAQGETSIAYYCTDRAIVAVATQERLPI
jgi:hypothetical protein